MSDIVRIGDATLYLGDCLEILPTLDKVDAVVTSPPYGQQRDYGAKIKDWRALVSTALLKTPSHETTQILCNLGLIHKDGRVIRYWDDLISDMESGMWRLFGWYVWDKIDGMGGHWAGRLAPSHEWVFHFNMESRPANKTYFSKLAGLVHRSNPGLRGKDGKAKGYAHEGREVQAFKVPDSVIRVHPERQNYHATEHPAVFPVLLPRVLIETYTDSDGVCLDPFMGSGTVGAACANLGRKFIGIEIERKYFDIACERIEAAYAQGRLFA